MALYSWQLDGWKSDSGVKFEYDNSLFNKYHDKLLELSGICFGVQKALSDDDRQNLIIGFLTDEAYKTSEIEGELLDRDSLQSSIQKYLGLKLENSKNHPRENGIAMMMSDLYYNYSDELSHDLLHNWHKMLMNGRVDIEVGNYRTHETDMRIISGRLDKPTIHYIAPPSEMIFAEMERFITWYNKEANKLPPLIASAIAHLYFELIHPYEDGNGRIGRAIIEKYLSQYFDRAILISMSNYIYDNRKDYYSALEQANKTLKINQWLEYFCQMIIASLEFTIEVIDFKLKKSHFFHDFGDLLNPRQMKLMQKIFSRNKLLFAEGMTPKKYISLTKTSQATANRDLNDLVDKNILKRQGELKATRYFFIK